MNSNSIRLIIKAVPLGISVSTLVLVTLGSIEASSPITFLSIGPYMFSGITVSRKVMIKATGCNTLRT